MEARRITLLDLEFDQPLAWDLFDSEGQQVAARGQLLADRALAESLVRQGLFAQTSAPRALETPSVLRLLNRINIRLEKLLPTIATHHNALRDLQDVVQQIRSAVQISPDIALACIFLNQIAGIYSVRHCLESAIIALLVAQTAGLEESQQDVVLCAALTMNIGMLDFHEQLQARRHLLSDQEQSAIQRHPQHSIQILQQAGIENPAWIECVLHHHENADGSGYPFGKLRQDIPYSARLLAAADRYCALVSARNYRKSMLPDQALPALKRECGTENDLHHWFSQVLGPYPPGSLVKLANQEIAVVRACSRTQSNQPLHAQALIGPTGVPLLPATIVRDCRQANYAILHCVSEDDANIRFGMKQIWGAQAAL